MKDKFSIKRFIAFLLCAAMIITYMPTLSVAFADETSGEVVAESVEPEPTPEPASEPTPVVDPEPVVEEPIDEPAPDVVDPAPAEGEDITDPADPAEGEDIIEGDPIDEPLPEEEKFPEVSLSKTVDGVKVTLYAPEGALPEGVQLSVSKVNRADVFAAVDEVLEAEGKELVDAVAFDVTPLDKDGNEIQPNGSVKVTFSGSGLDGDDIDVFRVSDDASSVTEMGTSVATSNTQAFNTDHFTIFVAGGSATDPNGDGSNQQNSQNHSYVLEFGESVVLETSESNYRYGDWSIMEGSQYTEGFDATVREIKNNNTSDSDQTIRVRHRYGNNSRPSRWSSEYFYITAKSQKVTVEFMLQNVGSDSFEKIGDSIEVYKGDTIPTESIPNLDETIGEYKLYSWYSNEACTTEVDLTAPITGATTLYAKYAAEASITYNKNTSDAVTNMPSDTTTGVGMSVSIGAGPVRSEYAFLSWNTEADGSGTTVNPGPLEGGMPEGGLTLYAQWDTNKETVHIYYYRNWGNDSSSEPPIHTHDPEPGKRSQVELWEGIPERYLNYVFMGWSTDQYTEIGDAVEYYPNQTIQTGNEDTIKLYAVWGSLTDLIGPVTAKGKTVTYNGQTQSISGIEGYGNPNSNGYIEVTWTFVYGTVYVKASDFEASGINAGVYPTSLTAHLYYKNIIGSYTQIKSEVVEVKNNLLIIEPVKLTVETDSDTKAYDGDPLTAGGKVTFKDGTTDKEEEFTYDGDTITLVNNEKLFIKTTGSQTEVGESDNTYDLDWGAPSTANKYNYKFSEEDEQLGTLTVTGEEYEIAFDKNTEDDVTGMPEAAVKGTKDESGNVTATIPASTPVREGYKFLGWAKTASATTAEYQPNGTLTEASSVFVDGTMTLYAVWRELEQFTVSFVDDDGVTVFSSDNYTEGTAAADIVQPTVPNKTVGDVEYEFDKWTPDVADVTADATYTATYKEVEKYTVTYHANFSSDHDKTVEFKVTVGTDHKIKGYTTVFEEDIPENFRFEEWNTKADGTGTSYISYIAGNYGSVSDTTDLYAIWDVQGIPDASAKVFYDADPEDGGSVSRDAEALVASWELIPWINDIEYTSPEGSTATPADGYEFDGWYKVDPKTGAETKISSDVTLNARTILENMNTGTITNRILIWTFTKDVYKDTTFIAKFEQIKYTVTYSVEGDMPSDYTVPADVTDVVAGATVEVAATGTTAETSKDGIPGTWEFDGWTAPEGVTVEDGSFTMPANDVEFTGKWTFTATTYTVTWLNEDGSVLEKDENVEYGATPSYDGATPTKASDGKYTYTFAGWDKEITDVTEDATYTATYTAKAIPVNPDDDDDDDTTPTVVPAAANTDDGGDADDAEVIEDEPTPEAEPEVIDDEPTPTTLTWAVANLVMAIATVLGAAIALFRKKEDDEDEETGKKVLATKIAGALAGIAAPVTFFLTENMSNLPVAFDKWTPLMAVILAVQVVSAILGKVASKAADIKDAINE